MNCSTCNAPYALHKTCPEAPTEGCVKCRLLTEIHRLKCKERGEMSRNGGLYETAFRAGWSAAFNAFNGEGPGTVEEAITSNDVTGMLLTKSHPCPRHEGQTASGCHYCNVSKT